jgi:hypothetical protein
VAHQGESGDQNGDDNNTSKNHSPAGDFLRQDENRKEKDEGGRMKDEVKAIN